MRLLWENEAPLCSFIHDIQQQQCKLSGKVTGYSVFFLETILVPPIKFRPPAKGGDSVSVKKNSWIDLLFGYIFGFNIGTGPLI